MPAPLHRHPRRLRSLAVLLVAALGGTSAVASAADITLRRRAMIDGDQTAIRLADVARISGTHAATVGDVVVGTSDGTSARSISVVDVRAALDAAGISPADYDLRGASVHVRVGRVEARVGRAVVMAPLRLDAPRSPAIAAPADGPPTSGAAAASTLPSPPMPGFVTAADTEANADVRRAIARHLATTLDIQHARLGLAFARIDAELLNHPAAHPDAVDIGSITFDGRTATARLTLTGSAVHAASTHEVRFRVFLLADRARLARDIPAGTMLTGDDLHPVPTWIEPGRRPSVVTPEDAVGATVTTAVTAGDVLDAEVIAYPTVITRGAPVQIRLRTGGIVLTRSGRAREDGGLGSVIDVRFERDATDRPARVVGTGVVELIGTSG